MQRLADRGHAFNLVILDNEASADFCTAITQEWGHTFQLVPPNVHRHNVVESTIRTFKAHFLTILASIPSNSVEPPPTTNGADPQYRTPITHGTYQHGSTMMCPLILTQHQYDRWASLS